MFLLKYLQGRVLVCLRITTQSDNVSVAKISAVFVPRKHLVNRRGCKTGTFRHLSKNIFQIP